MALQAPGEDHLGSQLCRNSEGQCCLGMHIVTQVVHMRFRGTRLDIATESQDLQVLILFFQEEFRLCCSPFVVYRISISSKSLQDLGNAQTDLLHAGGFPVHSPDQAPIHVLEENDRHLAPQGLPLVDPVFFPSQGLVLCDVQDNRRFA